MWKPAFVLAGHSAPIYACTSDSDWIYSTAGDRFVARWDIHTGQQDGFTVRLEQPAYALLKLVKHSILLIGTTNGTLTAIDTVSKQLLWEKNFGGKAIFSLVDLVDSELIAIGDEQGNLWISSYSGTLIGQFHLNCGKIRQLNYSERTLFAACQDGTVRQFELPTFNEVFSQKTHEGGANASLHFPNEHGVWTSGRDGHMKYWDLLTYQLAHSIPAHYQTIYGIIHLTQFQELVSVSMDKTIKIWDVESMKVKQRIEFKNGGHNRSVNGCVMIGEERFLTFGDDKRVVVWGKGVTTNCFLSD